MDRANFSVVVATRDRPALLEGCLDALRASVGTDGEIVVVDSASSRPGNAAVVANHGARLIRTSLPGASLARNVGWQASSGDWIAFVDDDVRVDPLWADALRQSLTTHGEMAFITGRLRLDDADADTERPVAVFDDPQERTIHSGTVDDVGHGANIAIRRDALNEVGGYDETLGPGTTWTAGEDLELIDRLLAGGFTGRYEPAASARHVQWRSRKDLYPLEWRYGVGQGARLALLWRIDRVRFRAIARRTTWDLGVVELAVALRRGWERVAARTLLRLAGTLVGAVGVASTRLLLSRRPGQNGH
jgi:glycosyltransferase involved in cell wall biosynthesis